jgi:hypothetical protein
VPGITGLATVRGYGPLLASHGGDSRHTVLQGGGYDPVTVTSLRELLKSAGAAETPHSRGLLAEGREAERPGGLRPTYCLHVRLVAERWRSSSESCDIGPVSKSAGLVRYASSWMKCHHPDVFLAAILNAQPTGFYPPHTLVRDARQHGVEVRPVDVNNSEFEATLEETDGKYLAVRLGLGMTFKLSEKDARTLVAAWGARPCQSNSGDRSPVRHHDARARGGGGLSIAWPIITSASACLPAQRA